MNVVILDGYSINPGDLSWDPLAKICNLTYYDRTDQEQILKRCRDMDGIYVSQCEITGEMMDALPRLRYIGVTATGYNHVDVQAAKERGIAVTNNPAYSTEAVAQHTFALILELVNHTGLYHHSVLQGDWYDSPDFCYMLQPLTLLAGKSLGIIGYGRIGKQVAGIAEAFGMKVNVYSKNPEAAQKSDILTLHCPLNSNNHKWINRDFIAGMKDGALLINTARGGLIDEADVLAALRSGKLAGAGLDVLEQEPPSPPHPLIGAPNCIVTPHVAWMPRETRQKVVDVSTANLESYLNGGMLNRIV